VGARKLLPALPSRWVYVSARCLMDVLETEASVDSWISAHCLHPLLHCSLLGCLWPAPIRLAYQHEYIDRNSTEQVVDPACWILAESLAKCA